MLSKKLYQHFVSKSYDFSEDKFKFIIVNVIQTITPLGVRYFKISDFLLNTNPVPSISDFIFSTNPVPSFKGSSVKFNSPQITEKYQIQFF